MFDPSVAICRDTFEVAPDVIVFPSAKIKQVLPAPDTLPREAWRRVADGRCLVVFDASTDGNIHTAATSGRLHDYLASAGVPPERAAYITQDRSWADAYHAHADRFGLRRMQVAHYDYFLKFFFRDFERNGQALFEQRLALFRDRPKTRTRRYICLNLSPRAAKVLLLARLRQHGFFDDGHISFGGFDESKHSRAVSLKVMLGQIADLPGFGRIAGEVMPWVYELTKLDPMLLGDFKVVDGAPGHIKKQAADKSFDEYSDSFFTVATETELNSRRISEKALKALTNFHPQLVLGNQDSMGIIRRMGFQGFEGYLDEGYDDEPNEARRFDRVAEETLRLCGLPHEELYRLEQEWAEVLTHNARHGLCVMPGVYRDEIDPALARTVKTMFRMDGAGEVSAAA